MAFPTIATAIDDFNRADGDPGANWTAFQGAGTKFRIATNVAVANDSYSAMYWSAAQFGPDIECYVTLGRGNADPFANYCAIWARCQNPGAATDGYRVAYHPESAGTISIDRIDNGSETLLDDVALTTLNNGDALGIEIIGSTIKAYVREGGVWSEVLSVTDATYSGTGYFGLDVFDPGGDDMTFDNFSGGTIAGAIDPVDLISLNRNRSQRPAPFRP